MKWLKWWLKRPPDQGELQDRKQDADDANKRLDRKLAEKEWVERRIEQHLRDNHLVDRVDAIFRRSL